MKASENQIKECCELLDSYSERTGVDVSDLKKAIVEGRMSPHAAVKEGTQRILKSRAGTS